MADWHVAKIGNDTTGDGSLGNPYLTLTKAQTVSSATDRVFIHAGIYTHVNDLDSTKWMDRDWYAYNGEDVTIDANGGLSCFDGALALGGMTVGNTYTISGIKFTGYIGTCMGFDNSNPSGGIANWTVHRCFFRAATTTASRAIHMNSGLFPANVKPSIIGCSFIDNDKALSDVAFYGDVIMNLFDGNATYDMADFPDTSEAFNGISGNCDLKDWNAYSGMTEDTNGVDTGGTVAFNNRPGLDFSLPPASALRGAGQFGANIGAAFNPRIFVDNGIYDLWNGLSNGANDPLYYTGGSPGAEGPVDAAPAIFSGGNWKIDNIAEPTGKSARVRIGPLTLAPGSKLTVGSLQALVNEVPASGSKEIVGVTVTDRDWHLSINGGVKTVIDWNTFVDLNATTIDLYMTLRADGETEV